MDDQNRFNEYLEKFQKYVDLFITACYVWMQKAGTWIMENGRKVIQLLAILLLKARDLVEQLIRWVKEQAGKVNNRLESGRAQKPAELPAAEEVKELPAAEEVKELPAVTAEEPQIIENVSEPNAEAAVVSVPVETVEAPAQEQEPVQQEAQSGDSVLRKIGAVLAAIGRGFKFVVRWLWKLRKLIMAAPVVWAAVKLAMQNMERLPESVGLDIQSTGEFARMITRQEAVYWPLGITMFCLLLMFLSKKPLLPWVTSIFTLVLPWLIWLLNYYA